KVTSMENLLLELSKGTPVVVFQNLGFDWYELWHYSLVTGYDLGKRELFLNSGKEQDLRLSFDKFERGWKRGGYWGVALLPAGMLSETGTLIDHLKAAAAIEKAGKRDLASKAYKAILSRWNDSHWAWFGLGNLNGQEGELEMAKKNFELALKINPQFSYAWYNYAFLLKNLGQGPSAKSAAANAIKYVDPVNKGLFRESLSDANLL
ncbi:MAG: PA2778 family cysteine peptidase, partial [Bacteriovoracaceae bacterium]|nr:PA2778 family cysteine peptidase [Bacteriovoracaceae bacterium]